MPGKLSQGIETGEAGNDERVSEVSFSRTLKEKSEALWELCYQHPFLQEMGRGTLSQEKFCFYLIQDYCYLIDYAKIFSMGILKAGNEMVMKNFSASQYFTLHHEMDYHRAYMKRNGIESGDIVNVRQAFFNRAYTSNMLAVGQLEGVAEIIAVVLPCAWTYHDYAVRLLQDYGDISKNEEYWTWMASYASDTFRESFQWYYDVMDDLCQDKSPRELKRLEEIFHTSLEFEYLFWDMAYKRQLSL